MYHGRYLASLLCVIAIQNVLAEEGKYLCRYPDAQTADYLTIDAQDSLVVEWIQNGSIESTEAGASNASVLGSSMASLVVGLIAFTCLLA